MVKLKIMQNYLIAMSFLQLDRNHMFRVMSVLIEDSKVLVCTQYKGKLDQKTYKIWLEKILVY